MPPRIPTLAMAPRMRLRMHIATTPLFPQIRNSHPSFRFALRRTYATSSSSPPDFNWGRFAFGAGMGFLAFHMVTKYIVAVHNTIGPSMTPTIHGDQSQHPQILISKLHSHGRGVKVGDLITYRHPTVPRQFSCKRIIGMPGDLICLITPGKTEDGDVMEEDDKVARVEQEMFRVPEGHCWVSGDNLEWSKDSRNWGPLPLALVHGKALALVLPLSNRKWFGDGLTDFDGTKHETVLQKP